MDSGWTAPNEAKDTTRIDDGVAVLTEDAKADTAFAGSAQQRKQFPEAVASNSSC
jgi:hypothetical protein